MSLAASDGILLQEIADDAHAKALLDEDPLGQLYQIYQVKRSSPSASEYLSVGIYSDQISEVKDVTDEYLKNQVEWYRAPLVSKPDFEV